MNVRPATAEDADAIGRVQVETWRAAYRGLMPDEAIAQFDVEERRRMWREGLAREAAAGQRDVRRRARGRGRRLRERRRGTRRGGCGRALRDLPPPHVAGTAGSAGRSLERAEESMRSSGFTRAILWVMEGNERGERFYRAAGWEPRRPEARHLPGRRDRGAPLPQGSVAPQPAGEQPRGHEQDQHPDDDPAPVQRAGTRCPRRR